MDTDLISYDDFSKLHAVIGTILSVEIVEGADKLLKLSVNVGEEAPRQIVSGIREFFDDPQALVGKQCPFLINLQPRTIRGLESQGMILAAGDDEHFALLESERTVPPGTPIR